MTSREVLAFDLYETLADPIAIVGELGLALGDTDGREAARLWRLISAVLPAKSVATPVSLTLSGVSGAEGRQLRPFRCMLLNSSAARLAAHGGGVLPGRARVKSTSKTSVGAAPRCQAIRSGSAARRRAGEPRCDLGHQRRASAALPGS